MKVGPNATKNIEKQCACGATLNTWYVSCMEVRPGHWEAEQGLLERTEMRILIWMMGIKRIEKITTEEIRARAGAANISETIREARLGLLGHVERKTEEDIVMRTWKWVDIEIKTKTEVEWWYKKNMKEKGYREEAQDRRTWRLKTWCANLQIGKRLKKKTSYNSKQNWPLVSLCRPWAPSRDTAVWSHAPSCWAAPVAWWSHQTARYVCRGRCVCWCRPPGSCWRVVRQLRRRRRWWGAAGTRPRAPRNAPRRPWWRDRPEAATAHQKLFPCCTANVGHGLWIWITVGDLGQQLCEKVEKKLGLHTKYYKKVGSKQKEKSDKSRNETANTQTRSIFFNLWQFKICGVL